jgi:hypothetical protein
MCGPLLLRNVGLHSDRPVGNLTEQMSAQNGTFRPGDRVVHLQVPGVFVVIGLRAGWVEIESDRGLRMTVRDVQVRKLEGPPPAPADA